MRRIESRDLLSHYLAVYVVLDLQSCSIQFLVRKIVISVVTKATRDGNRKLFTMVFTISYLRTNTEAHLPSYLYELSSPNEKHFR